MAHLRAVIPATLFDYNGVLVDDEAVHLAAFRDALAPLGVKVEEADYWSRYIGFDDVGAFRAMLSDAGRAPTDEDVRRLVEAKRPLYLARAEAGLSVFEGAAEWVRRRAAVGPVGIVSGALRDEIELGLDVLGVRDLVAFVISAEDTKEGKPDPEGYRLGLARLGTEAVVIEDSVAGVQAAKAAGLRCVAVGHSYPEAELRAAGADVVRGKIADLCDEDFST
ncbi:MAG: HAD family phosphatase [Myxococcales bacterium]|nr:HAD family phosphatase [Myxococcales bacterium]MCB9580307.1 HAD family phosphatase [Polyangiaceae bacterium]